MDALESANLALRFLLELDVLVALGYWEFATGRSGPAEIGLGIGLPLLVAVIWGTLVAPNAPVELATPLRVLVELVIFGIGVAALYAAGRPRPGLDSSPGWWWATRCCCLSWTSS
jgi:hypothetical protein